RRCGARARLAVPPRRCGRVTPDPAPPAAPPALVRPAPAGLRPPRAHVGERARRRRRLALGVVSPAGNGAVGLEPTGVLAPRAHLREGARRWRGLAVIVEAPAGDAPVGLEPAGVASTRAQLRAGVRVWWCPLGCTL